jgi:16S rRNA C967 or C1407 C5-methylase (RsmB/RsmF family)
MEWNNQAAASYARVNRLRAQPAGVLECWASEGVRATHVPLDWAEDGDLYLVTLPCAVHLLKSFEDGLFYMQDPSTLLAVHALDVKPGQFVVDLCAAPGGKTSLIAQKMGNAGTLLASDIDAERLQLVRENGLRLGVTCLHTSPASSLAATLHPLFLAHQLGQAGVSDPLMPGAESVLEVRGGKVGGEEGGGAAGELGDDSGKNSQKYSLYDFYIVNILGP